MRRNFTNSKENPHFGESSTEEEVVRVVGSRDGKSCSLTRERELRAGASSSRFGLSAVPTFREAMTKEHFLNPFMCCTVYC